MTLELVCRAEVLGGDEEGGDEEGAVRRAASTTDGAPTSVFGHVCRWCVCTRGPCRRRHVLLSVGRLQPGRRGPCCTTNRIGGFRPWRRVANTECRQTGSMRRVWSRRILRKCRTRGGRRRRRSAGPNVLMHSPSTFATDKARELTNPNLLGCKRPTLPIDQLSRSCRLGKNGVSKENLLAITTFGANPCDGRGCCNMS